MRLLRVTGNPIDVEGRWDAWRELLEASMRVGREFGGAVLVL